MTTANTRLTEARFNTEKIGNAIKLLKTARDILKEANALKAAQKVRAAIKSAEGAERHAQGKEGEAYAAFSAENRAILDQERAEAEIDRDDRESAAVL